MRGLLNLLLRLNLYCIVNILLSFIQLGEYFFQLQLNKLLHIFVGNLPREINGLSHVTCTSHFSDCDEEVGRSMQLSDVFNLMRNSVACSGFKHHDGSTRKFASAETAPSISAEWISPVAQMVGNIHPS